MPWVRLPPRSSTVAAVASVLALACGSGVDAPGLRYGPEVTLGAGSVRTYLVLDAEGRPSELGIALSESALKSLPDLADKPDEEAFLLLDPPLPSENPTPYKLASIDWNPRGHPPVMYGLPHFDFHFYLIGAAERAGILPIDSAEFEARGMKSPAEGYLPTNYVNPGGATVPQMGSHWIDPASHEFHGQRSTGRSSTARGMATSSFTSR